MRRRSALLAAAAVFAAAAVAVFADGDRDAADAAFGAGRWADAAALYEKVTVADKANVSAWLRLAIARIELGTAADARRAVAGAAAAEGRTARVEFVAGRVALVDGSFDEAVTAFRAARAKDAAFEPAWGPQNLGYALFRLGRFAEARAAFRDVLARPRNELASRMYVNAVETELALGATADACRIAAAGRAAFPDDPWLANIHGWSLTLATDKAAATAAYARARELVRAARDASPPVVVQLPMSGRLLVIQGPGGVFSHESLRNAEAIDLVAVDPKSGEAVRKDGARNEDHVCFDRPVVAVLDGEVVVALDGLPDNAPGKMNPAEPRGNHVYLRHGPGLFTRYFHLKQGSVEVRPGARVHRGDVIGHCGNSGYSRRPHLCFAALAALPEADLSVPLRFGPCVQRKDGRDHAVETVVPAENDVLENPPRK